jgi:membrane fusion protein (multidrug efflux system)
VALNAKFAARAETAADEPSGEFVFAAARVSSTRKSDFYGKQDMLRIIYSMRKCLQALSCRRSLSVPEAAERVGSRLHGTVFYVGLMLGMLLIPGCQSREESGYDGEMPVHVEVAPVKVADLQQELPAVGSLSSPQETVVAPQISGRIVSLDIAQGQVLQRGTILARLDDSIQKAALAAAEATLTNARGVYERDRQVVKTGGVSEQQLQSDETAVQQAEAQVRQAQVNLQYTTIRAPFTGALGLRQVSLGAYLQAGDAIVRIRQMDPLYLDFEIPQQAVGRIRLGQTAKFAVPGLTGDFEGTVTTIDPALDAASRNVHVQATVPNPKLLLKPGMFARVRLIVATKPETLFVPAQAIVPQGDVRYVWIVAAGDKAEQRSVEVGVYRNNWVEIISGLKPADRVVTAGVQKLYPGAKLMVSPYQPIHNRRLDLANPQENSAS